MKKLNLENIKLKSRGEQLKEAILYEYYSVEMFSKVIDMSPKTIHPYLKGDSLGSFTFQTRVEKAFGTDIDNLP